MDNKYDVIALGELLIDFTENGVSNQGNPLFEANPGGAPCNVLSMLCKLSKKTAFIGKVGNDSFGLMLRDTLINTGISTEGLKFSESVPTTLAFIHNDKNGERSFSFYRNPGADVTITPEDIDENLIKNAKVFHFGTLSMTAEPAISAIKQAVSIAKKHNLTISFDPNLREPLWKSLDDAKRAMEYGLSVSDVVKISDNEVTFFTGLKDVKKGAEIIFNRYDVKLLMVTLGKEGSFSLTKDINVKVPAIISDKSVDSTGAGDTYMGCMLCYLLDTGFLNITEANLKEAMTFASIASSIITTRKGALKVMPGIKEINEYI